MALLLLVGCREVRVSVRAHGTTTSPGGNQLIVVRDEGQMESIGVKASMNFRAEFGVVLLMGPYHRTGYRQVIESIHATDGGERVVAFEDPPADGGEPSRDYRTYTLFVVPNSAYQRGFPVQVVTPSDDPVAQTVLP